VRFVLGMAPSVMGGEGPRFGAGNGPRVRVNRGYGMMVDRAGDPNAGRVEGWVSAVSIPLDRPRGRSFTGRERGERAGRLILLSADAPFGVGLLWATLGPNGDVWADRIDVRGCKQGVSGSRAECFLHVRRLVSLAASEHRGASGSGGRGAGVKQLASRPRLFGSGDTRK